VLICCGKQTFFIFCILTGHLALYRCCTKTVSLPCEMLPTNNNFFGFSVLIQKYSLMSLVFNFSQDLICELFTNWFGPLETTLFDSALCNKELRVSLLDSFLSVLYHHKGCDELEFNPKEHQKNHDFNAWIVLRKIKIVALKLEKIDLLTKEFDVLLTDKLQDLSVELSRGHRKINKFELCAEEHVLQYVSTKCSQLRCLEITFHTKGNELEVVNFINNNNHLKTVQLFFDSSLGNKCLQAISSSCVNIEQVHIHHAASDVHLNNITAVLKTCKLLKFMTLVFFFETRMFRIRNETDEHDGKRRCYLRLSGFDEASEIDRHALMMEVNCVSVLWLSHFSLTDDFITRSMQSLSQLEFLTLNSCGSLFSRAGLIQLISQCKKLNKIHLKRCSHLSNLDLIDILTLKGNVLETVGISGHNYLDLTTLSTIVFANKNILTQVYFAECEHLEDRASVEHSLRLQKSDIIMCNKIVIESV
jgi:hypothetical protein